jgi:hypothetical protein
VAGYTPAAHQLGCHDTDQLSSVHTLSPWSSIHCQTHNLKDAPTQALEHDCSTPTTAYRGSIVQPTALLPRAAAGDNQQECQKGSHLRRAFSTNLDRSSTRSTPRARSTQPPVGGRCPPVLTWSTRLPEQQLRYLWGAPHHILRQHAAAACRDYDRPVVPEQQGGIMDMPSCRSAICKQQCLLCANCRLCLQPPTCGATATHQATTSYCCCC